jgi:predicted RNA-binding protein YlxR (DUF448 family)
MTRVVRAADGSVTVDPTGKAAGRGTYVCDDPSCREPTRMAEAVKRALEVAIVPGVLELEEKHAAT